MIQLQALIAVKIDKQNCKDIEAIWEKNRSVYGAKKVRHALRREGKDIVRCTVERLMKQIGILRGCTW